MYNQSLSMLGIYKDNEGAIFFNIGVVLAALLNAIYFNHLMYLYFTDKSFLRKMRVYFSVTFIIFLFVGLIPMYPYEWIHQILFGVFLISIAIGAILFSIHLYKQRSHFSFFTIFCLLLAFSVSSYFYTGIGRLAIPELIAFTVLAFYNFSSALYFTYKYNKSFFKEMIHIPQSLFS
jgi:hypothetical protein